MFWTFLLIAFLVIIVYAIFEEFGLLVIAILGLAYTGFFSNDSSDEVLKEKDKTPSSSIKSPQNKVSNLIQYENTKIYQSDASNQYIEKEDNDYLYNSQDNDSYNYIEYDSYEQVRVGAICNDGTISNATGSGACSHHGGVAEWIYE